MDTATELERMKNRAWQVADQFTALGYGVIFRYATDQGLPDETGLIVWDIHNDNGPIGGIRYDAGGVIVNGDELENLVADGTVQI